MHTFSYRILLLENDFEKPQLLSRKETTKTPLLMVQGFGNHQLQIRTINSEMNSGYHSLQKQACIQIRF